MKKYFYISGVVLLFLCLMYMLLATNRGLKSSLFILHKIMPGNFTIQRSDGTLTSTVVLENINYKNEKMQISCSVMRWDWKLKKLFSRREMAFGHISIDDVYVHFIKSSPAVKHKMTSFDDIKQALTWFKWISFNDFTLRNANIFYTTSPYHIRLLSIWRHTPTTYSFRIQPTSGELIGKITAKVESDLHWSLYLTGSQLNPGDVWPALPGSINFIMTSTGKWDHTFKHVSFQLNELSGFLNHYPVSGYAGVLFNDDTIIIKKIDLRIADASAFFQGSLKPNNENMQWSLSLPRLSTLYPNFSGNMFLSGRFSQSGGKPYIAATISSQNLKIQSLTIQSIQGKMATQLPSFYSSLQLSIKNIHVGSYQVPSIKLASLSQLMKERLQINSVLSLNRSNQIKATLTILNIHTLFSGDAALSGKGLLEFNDLNQLVKSDYVKQLSGILQGTIDLAGTVAAPKFSGTLNLLKGRFSLPALGISPQAISLQSRFEMNKPIDLNGTFTSGMGKGHVQGKVEIYQPNFPFSVTMTGDNLQVANLAAYKIRVSPAITIHSTHQNIEVRGTLSFPFIEIVTDTLTQGVVLPSEVVIVGQRKNAVTIPSQVAMQIRVALGDHISLSYQSLRAKLAGNITVSQIAGGLPTASGILYVTQGSYFIYNQFLTIKNGRLIYVGNGVTDPALNISATKQIKTSSTFSFTTPDKDASSTDEANSLFVGANIQGTLHNPQVTLISNPPMNQDDILSYLLFGFPRSQLTGVNSLSALGTIAAGLNILQPNASDGGADAQPPSGLLKLGMFNPVQVFGFSIPFGKHWSIKTEASIEETGADILYRYSHD